ncbi:MAG: DMT family transporter [Candidatus Aminicenantes bacterium]|nr:DMT family transporter [Candidatus Aminicenantes bacterium]
MKNNTNGKGLGLTDLMMLVTVVIWALNFSILKLSLPFFPSPHAFNILRLLVATAILFAILFFREKSAAVSRSDFLMLALIGVMGNFLYQALFIQGLKWTSATNTSLILATTPVLVALISLLLKHERLPAVAWAGIVISFSGLYLIITRQPGALSLGGPTLKGDALVFVGNVFWTLYTVFSKPLLERISPLKLTAWTMASGTLAYLPLAAPDLGRMNWRLPLGAWAGLAYSAVFAIVIGFVVWYASVRRVGNSRTAIYGNITPVLTAVSAHIILNERLSGIQAVGAAVILVGVYLTRSGHRLFPKPKIPSSNGA